MAVLVRGSGREGGEEVATTAGKNRNALALVRRDGIRGWQVNWRSGSEWSPTYTRTEEARLLPHATHRALSLFARAYSTTPHAHEQARTRLACLLLAFWAEEKEEEAEATEQALSQSAAVCRSTRRGQGRLM